MANTAGTNAAYTQRNAVRRKQERSRGFMLRIACLLAAALCITPLYAQSALPVSPGTLRVGAAKVDITPPQSNWKDLDGFNTHTYELMHDPIYARAIIIDAGSGPVAFVELDLVHLMDTTPFRQQIQKEVGISADHIVITATHDHSGPSFRGAASTDTPQFPATPAEDAFMIATRQKILEVAENRESRNAARSHGLWHRPRRSEREP